MGQQHYQIEGKSAKEIVKSVELGVRNGLLPPGTKLPSVRVLAGQLGISTNTVAAAYRQLSRRGIVLARERRAGVIAPRPPIAGNWSHPIIPPDLRDLTSGNPDPALLPDLRPALQRIEATSSLYGVELVAPKLLQLACQEFAPLNASTENITLVNGNLDGLERVLQAHLRPGDAIAVEDPGHAYTFDLIHTLGLIPVPVEIDDFGMRPEALADVLPIVDAVLITPRAQNPTGASLNQQRATELRDVLARAPELLVIEHDHLGRVAGPEDHTTLSARRSWALIRSVAMWLGPDIRLAFLVGDAETVARVSGRLALGPAWVSHLLQRLVFSLATDESIVHELTRTIDTYATRRQALLTALQHEGIAAHGRSGFNVWIPVADEDTVVRHLYSRGWAVMPGRRYRINSPPAIRVTTATLNPSEASTLAHDIATALAPSNRSRLS